MFFFAAGALLIGPPWCDVHLIYCCRRNAPEVKSAATKHAIQVWARGMRQKKTSPCSFPHLVYQEGLGAVSGMAESVLRHGDGGRHLISGNRSCRLNRRIGLYALYHSG